MEKSLIGRRYVVKDNSYSKDLSGNCQYPTLHGQEGIIIHHPYTECHNGHIHLFVDIVIPNNPFYKHHYRVLFYEWGLLDKGEKEQNKNAVLGLVGAIYHPTYNASFCRVLGQDLVEGYLSGVDCEILSLPYYKTFSHRYSNEIKRVKVINVRSLETGIEYIIEYKNDWMPKYRTTYLPKKYDNIDKWNFCPHCGKKLR